MLINHFEISNFRKLRSVRIDVADRTTLFVGANNSGKTSAMLALRRFLVKPDEFSMNDFTLCNWPAINTIGETWVQGKDASLPGNLDIAVWCGVLPALDVWLQIENGEIHHVSRLIPTLDWNGGLLGVRLRLEPKNLETLYKDFLTAVGEVSAMRAELPSDDDHADFSLKLWPENLIAFLERKMGTYFTVRTYALDPSKCEPPKAGQAQPQFLGAEADPIDGSPLKDLIRIDEINAQRGFGHMTEDASGGEDGASRDTRKLSEQLRRYYTKHLDPFDRPDVADLGALKAIEVAQKAFDQRLEEGFQSALSEVQGLGYPGITDPKLKISTRLRPIDGLDHDTAVQYEIDVVASELETPALRLPESYNGLGYQNLISMVFRLMSFRDAWMRVGKAGKGGLTSEAPVRPLHLVLVEEPEAHLHAQVQQVFIKKAYDILRSHTDLGGNPRLRTQLIVSTHSSHVAHETSFSCLRYFRRLPAGLAGDVPVSTVVNLSEVFGDGDDTRRFETRYLKAQHCDLFFADAAILVEGPAERMLVPHFIRSQFDFLSQCYVTLLEIGGSHAHRLEPLIRHLGLLTLVITDIDAGRELDGASQQPVRGQKQVTNNSTLKQWLPRLQTIDDLLNADLGKKELTYDPLFAVRVAYQSPTMLRLSDVESVEALANTFEDALVFENRDFFSDLDGSGLVRKFREAIAEHQDMAALGQALFGHLRTGKKAEFALDIIDSEHFETLKPPAYIADGLHWLEGRLHKKQAEIFPAPLPEGVGV